MSSSLWQLDIDLLFKCLWQETRTLFIAPSIREFSQKTLKTALRASSSQQQQQALRVHSTLYYYYYYYYYYYIASMQGMYIYIPETNPVPILELVI